MVYKEQKQRELAGSDIKPETDSALNTKLMRLMQIREQLTEYKEWKHPSPDEVEHILYLMEEWYRVAELKLPKDELNCHAKGSVFPSLIRFCQAELLRIVKYCESRRAAGLRTHRDNIIDIIRELGSTRDLDAINTLFPFVEHIHVTGILARIIQTSHQAMLDPGVLTELEIQKLRGDILEVVANTYSDIIEAMKDQASKNVEAEINHVNRSKAGATASRKLTNDELALMKTRAVELKAKHSSWKKSDIARRLSEEFPLSYHTIRKFDWL